MRVVLKSVQFSCGSMRFFDSCQANKHIPWGLSECQNGWNWVDRETTQSSLCAQNFSVYTAPFFSKSSKIRWVSRSERPWFKRNSSSQTVAFGKGIYVLGFTFPPKNHNFARKVLKYQQNEYSGTSFERFRATKCRATISNVWVAKFNCDGASVIKFSSRPHLYTRNTGLIKKCQ